MSELKDSGKVGAPAVVRDELLAEVRRWGVVTAAGLADIMGWDRKRLNVQLRRYGLSGDLVAPGAAPQAWTPLENEGGERVALLLVTRAEASRLGREDEWLRLTGDET